MGLVSKILNYFSSNTTTTPASPSVNHGGERSSIMPKPKTSPRSGEITPFREITDAEISLQQNRSKYITDKNNPDYKVAKGDNLEKIAKKYNVSIYALMMENNLNDKSQLSIGQKLKIPPTHNFGKIKNIGDISNALGVNKDFILRLKRIEDSQNLPDNKFHNTPYIDANGVKTIGIGHAFKDGDKQYLNDSEVCQLAVKDLLNAEDALKYKLGTAVYNKLPVNIKEALLDMVFNKGISVLEKSEGLSYCLKAEEFETEKYEAAINKMTFNRSVKTNEEMSGLSKRRLFDISIAIGIYKDGQVPETNIATAQRVYNRGVELLRQECRKKNLKFENQIVGYNKDIQKYFGNKIKLKYITQ